ncbi:MAG: phytoene desaturase family protein [Chlamydiota bacterium]
MKQAIIVGSGLGGISSALRLRAMGYNVHVVERQSEFGGKATTVVSGDYFYDAGPTVITASFLIKELFQLFGKSIDDYVELLPVSPWYSYLFPSGNQFAYGPSYEETLSEITRLYPEDTENYRKYHLYTKQLFEVGYEKYGVRPFQSFITLLSCLPDFLRLKAFESCYKKVNRFFTNEELVRAFSIPPLLIGGNPFKTPAIYLLIHHLENQWGVRYPKGGTKKLVDGLLKLAEEEGVTFQSGTSICSLGVENGLITHLIDNKGKGYDCDVVVFNGDPQFLYNQIIPRELQKWRSYTLTRRAKNSMGLFVMYFSTNRKYEEVPHHLILMQKGFRKHIDQVFKISQIPEQPNIYLHRPTATDPSMSKSGCDSFYALVPVPNLKTKNEWNLIKERYTKQILDILQKKVLPNLEDSLVDLCVTTPEDFATKQNCHNGSAFTLQPTFAQSAYFRYPNKLPEFENGYLVGAGTHPGAGVPGVMTSAKILEGLIG